MTKLFRLPVEWTVCDWVLVEAESLEDAVFQFQKKENEIPLGKNPEYIDGSYRLTTECEESAEDIAEELSAYYGECIASESDKEDCPIVLK